METLPSLWLDRLPQRASRPPLGGGIDVDVAIVGAGFTGLWTAYYLRTLAPELSVAVLEERHAGFGASGRNGGWCSGELPNGPAGWARRHGGDAAVVLQRAAFATLDEVERVVAAEGIDCGLRRGGTRLLALTAAQARRLRRLVAARHELGFGPDDYRLMDAAQTRRHLDVPGVRASVHTPHCAAVDPARLVAGLADAAERHGAALYEGTRVERIRPGRVHTACGTVRAGVVVRATEGFTPGLPGTGRTLTPLYSYMIATRPLPAEFWRSVGWTDGATVADQRFHFAYLQRTADGRIALGGRGVGYPWRSHVGPSRDAAPAVWRRLAATAFTLFPGLRELPGPLFTHRWGGPLAVARDLEPRVVFARDEGLAWAGGYGGDGVALAALAGRTLARLISGADGPETRLCWVGHRSREWEPEPLRWLGVRGVAALAHAADRMPW